MTVSNCTFSLCSAGNEPMTAPNDQVTKVELLSEQEAAIRLPGSLFRLITDAEDIGMTFGFYNESTLFPVGTGSAESRAIAERQTRVGSLIASAIVGLNRDFRNLEDPVTNTFQLQIPPDMV